MALITQTLVLTILLIGGLMAQLTAPPGPPGPPGSPGPTGATGPTGVKGDPGDVGEPGAQGASGEQGSPGVEGEAGDPGAKGDDGKVGLPGIEGEPGTAGSPGMPGLPGEQGATGATGMVGQPGGRGEKGEKGERGILGKDGVEGDVGEKGQKGTQGIRGDVGEKGASGPEGPAGATLMELDIDECADASNNECDPVSTTCHNLATGYLCLCRPGFKTTNSSIYECLDINECLEEDGVCPFNCVNNVGRYTCECPETTKSTANNQCADKDECTENLGLCGSDPDIYCINKYNGYSCRSSLGSSDDTTTVSIPVAAAVSAALRTNLWIVILLIWFGILTFITIIILIWLIYVFHKLKKDRDAYSGQLYDVEDDEMSDEEQYREGMAGSTDIHLTLPRPPRSQRGTMKGSKGKSYKGGSRPGSVSSGTSQDLRTASVKDSRVAAGEMSKGNRLSGVDTFY